MIEEIRVWGIHMGEHVGARPVEKRLCCYWLEGTW